MRKENEIRINEDVKIGDIILEKGDKIRVLESYDSDVVNKVLTGLEGKSDLSFADWVRKTADDMGETDVMDIIKADPKFKARMDKLMQKTGMDNPIASNPPLQKYWKK